VSAKPKARARPRSRGVIAYHRLRELIVHGRLAPGTWVIETDIARRLGVSRTPVRAALQRLEHEGFVYMSVRGRQSRAMVTPLTWEDARELFAIVGALEGVAARHAAQLPGPARREAAETLAGMNAELLEEARTPRPKPSRIFELDTRFHRRYVETGAGPRLLALHDAIKPQAERYIRLYTSALVDEIGTSVEEHEGIVGAVRGGDADAAQSAVRQNWSNAADRLKKVIETVGERGSW
jgi:DNA-binding GntR family transcriptional regulator